MGFLKKLFGGKKTAQVSEQSKSYSIDIRTDCFVINGKRLDIPIHIDALAAVLGKPREKHFKTDDTARHVLEIMHGEPVTNRVNYTWDDLGLMCYTHNGKVVNVFGICTGEQISESPSNPSSLYGGKLTINGEPWLPVILSGKDKDVFRELSFGNYLLTAEYSDFDQDDSTRDESSFTGIEINLPVKDLELPEEEGE